MRRHDGDPGNGRRLTLLSKHETSEPPAMTERHDLGDIAEGVGKGLQHERCLQFGYVLYDCTISLSRGV